MKVYHNLTRMTLNMGYITTKMASLAGAFISSIKSESNSLAFIPMCFLRFWGGIQFLGALSNSPGFTSFHSFSPWVWMQLGYDMCGGASIW